MTNIPVILASASASRANVLTAAGVPFTAQPAHVDEDGVKKALQEKRASAAACAEQLAEMKAIKISQSQPGAFVIGADQMLACDGRWYDKPPTQAAARDQLLSLAGKTHELPTAVVVARDGRRVWHHVAVPRLTMRAFDAAFVEGYIARVGDRVTSSVGAYHLEGLGIQLFDRIDGDFFTILGLPLLPLLAFLRDHRVIPN